MIIIFILWLNDFKMYYMYFIVVVFKQDVIWAVCILGTFLAVFADKSKHICLDGPCQSKNNVTNLTLQDNNPTEYLHSATTVSSHQKHTLGGIFLTSVFRLTALVVCGLQYICSSKYSWHKYLQSSETTHALSRKVRMGIKVPTLPHFSMFISLDRVTEIEAK